MADDLPVDSAGELAAELSGNGVRATVRTFPNTAIADDSGTDGPVRTLQQTQGTPAPSVNSILSGKFDGTAFQLSGKGAARDDSGKTNSGATQQIINDAFNGPVMPQPNVLDQYASYTYQLSWYLLTPDQYDGLATTNKINTNNWQLLVQSGGAPTQTTSASYSNFTRNTTTGRSQYFPYDYYLDNLIIENSLLGKGAHSAVNLTEIQFKVTEPNGITLINNLYAAVSNLYKSNGITDTASYQTAQHVMGIRFYGYDQNGNLVQGNNSIGDPSAIVEKYYPFRLTEMTFKMANRAIEYTILGSPLNYTIAASSQRGTIPHPFALAGQTLDELFNGNPNKANNAGATAVADKATGKTERKDSPNPPGSAIPNPPAKPFTAQQKARAQIADVANAYFNRNGAAKSASNDGWGQG